MLELKQTIKNKQPTNNKQKTKQNISLNPEVFCNFKETI